MCLNETRSRVRVGIDLSDIFHVSNGLKQRDALLSLLYNLASDCATWRIQANQDGL
jgi:hypothetical protein